MMMRMAQRKTMKTSGKTCNLILMTCDFDFTHCILVTNLWCEVVEP